MTIPNPHQPHPPAHGPSPIPRPQQAPHYQQAPQRQARDRAVYTRQQEGHSLTKHLLFGWVALYIPTIYYAVSPNHYWHI